MLSKNVVRNNYGTAVARKKSKEEQGAVETEDVELMAFAEKFGHAPEVRYELRAAKTRAHGNVEFSGNVFCDNGCNGPEPEELSEPPASPAAEEEQALLDDLVSKGDLLSILRNLSV